MTSETENLLNIAQGAARKAYAPYSNKPQGAALEASDGRVYAGASLELASWAGSLCAEAAALSAAITDGQRVFKRLAVVPSRTPCGVCLQAYREFGLDIEVMTNGGGSSVVMRPLRELLPSSFGPDSL